MNNWSFFEGFTGELKCSNLFIECAYIPIQCNYYAYFIDSIPSFKSRSKQYDSRILRTSLTPTVIESHGVRGIHRRDF